ncbi:MAG TPA: type I methionyl aminopeptidase [Pirellulaceae bacterium]|nr:type I methionyl aminopeptidase [Pirellulaceae bacterium]
MLQGTRKLCLNELEREMMRKACRFNAELMDMVRPHMQPGITTGAIDRLVHEYTISHGHRPACLGYPGKRYPFPKSCCLSINDVICHGIPGEQVLRAGDIVNVDLTSVVDGWHGDSSETFIIGDPAQVSPEARAVTQCAFDCMHLAIEAIRPSCRVSDIGEVIVAEAERRGFSVVVEYVGHGVGRQFHQKPSIPHAPTRQARGERLDPGLCFTIEPMINTGTRYTLEDKKDGWTVRTKDGGLSAQFEHTILMTESGPEILTQPKNGPHKGHKF